ncbi:GNAT family N-acetyltransferase [Rahnella sp. PCH160]|uniref:GNAT family N-acetyltransferase n=1 Tax=Rahnella sp. PCH160 TaxID=3447928 RepID=UPI0039FD22AE
MQQKNCMFFAIAHVLFKKYDFTLINTFKGSNNVQKKSPRLSRLRRCIVFPSLLISIKIIPCVYLFDLCTENVLLPHQRAPTRFFFSANTDFSPFLVGAIFAFFFTNALFFLLRSAAMKIVMLNAATLPVYRDELAQLLVEANSLGNSTGFPYATEQKDAEDSFNDLRPSLSQNERLLWIARDEQGVIGTVQLDLTHPADSPHEAEINTLLVCVRARRRGVGRLLMRELENAAQDLRCTVLSSDMESGSEAEAFYRAQGYRCAASKSDADHYSRKNEVVYYKRLSTFICSSPSLF